MKAEELMKGNWVFSKRFQRSVQIVGIASWVLYYVDGVPRTEKVEDVSPILITPEILEKNGFEKQGFDGWLLVKRIGDGLAWSILWRTDCPSPHLRIDSYSSQTGSFSSFAVNYVHQLQHVIRLCGIEKEIVI